MPIDLNTIVDTSALGKTTVKVAIEGLVAGSYSAPRDWQSHAPQDVYNGHKPPVQDSADLRRAIAVPRRPQPEFRGERAQALVQMMTARYAKPDSGAPCNCQSKFNRPCIKVLRPEQAVALYEMRVARGLFGSLAVGVGKTLLDILAPLAVPDVQKAVLLVPPKLVDPQLLANYEQISNHFKVPTLAVFGTDIYHHVEGAPTLYVLPYSRLQLASCTTKLEEINPDLIIADEMQNLRNPDSARAGRVIRYKDAHRRCAYVGYTGSPTDKSIKDYGAHMWMALGDSSPMPTDPSHIEDCARALDPSDWPAPPGPLVQLCPPSDEMPQLKGQARLQYGYQMRLRETEGIIMTTEASIDAALKIEERKAPSLPALIVEHLRTLRNEWIRPDGEELLDALAVARCARELACGFYLYWFFPHVKGKPQEREVVARWLDVRGAWRKEIRKALRDRKPHLDSPLLLARAAMRYHGDLPVRDVVEVFDEYGNKVGEHPGPEVPMWESKMWPTWRDTKDTVVYESRCHRVDPFIAQDAARWAAEHRGIVWYQSKAMGQWVAELSGLPTFGAGDSHKLHEYLASGAEHSMIVSMIAHGTGTDGLQYHYDDQLIIQPPPSSERWEQVLGRLHRPGQKSGGTRADVYRHTAEMAAAVDQAIIRATYVTRTMGAPQKLLVGGDALGMQAQAEDEDWDACNPDDL